MLSPMLKIFQFRDFTIPQATNGSGPLPTMLHRKSGYATSCVIRNIIVQGYFGNIGQHTQSSNTQVLLSLAQD